MTIKYFLIISLVLISMIGILDQSKGFFADSKGRLTQISEHDVLYKINLVRDSKQVFCVGLDKDYTLQDKNLLMCFPNQEVRNKFYWDLNKELTKHFTKDNLYEDRE